MILAGNGCVRKRSRRQLRQFIKCCGIGVINTFMAKGCVDMESEQCLYTIGLQAKDVVACAIDNADLVLTLGYDMVEYHPRLWNPQSQKRIIHADFLLADIDANYHPEVEVVGDLAHAMWMLNVRAQREPLSFDTSHQDAVRSQMQAEIEEYRDDDTEGT